MYRANESALRVSSGADWLPCVDVLGVRKGGRQVKVQKGTSYKIPFPYHIVQLGRDEHGAPDEGWKPGCFREVREDYAGSHGMISTVSYCHDDWGWMRITVHDIITISGFQERCFYTLSWIDPEGREFGLRTLRMKSTKAVNKMLEGHRYTKHPELVTIEEEVK
jgi:hypothetical protein